MRKRMPQEAMDKMIAKATRYEHSVVARDALRELLHEAYHIGHCDGSKAAHVWHAPDGEGSAVEYGRQRYREVMADSAAQGVPGYCHRCGELEAACSCRRT